MLVNVVKIGNSRGLRIPKPILEQLGITDSADMTVEAGRLVIGPIKPNPRAGWPEQIDRGLALYGDPAGEFADFRALENEFDEIDWTWPEEGQPALTTDQKKPLK